MRRTALQTKLDSIIHDHGDSYVAGIQPRLDHALLMYYDIIFGRLTAIDHDITACCIVLLNCVDPDMLQYMGYDINKLGFSRGETHKLDREFNR